MSLLLLAVLGAAADEPEAVPPPENLAALHKALSSRHPLPCDELEALTPRPVEALLYVVDHVGAPPWAGMRAAECLTRHHAESIEPQLREWVTSPQLKGLGRQTVALADVMPEGLALRVVKAALRDGPEPQRVRQLLKHSDRAELRALAGDQE